MLREEVIKGNKEPIYSGDVISFYKNLFTEKLASVGCIKENIYISVSTVESYIILKVVESNIASPFGPTERVYGDIVIVQFPYCCGICVIGNSHTHYHHNIGIGSLMVELAQDYAYVSNYTIAMVADRINNGPTQKIFKKQNWINFIDFKNNRTKNNVQVRFKRLRELDPISEIKEVTETTEVLNA